MAESNDRLNPFDPAGLFKTMQDHHMDAWSKAMVQFVNTEAYAEATGAILNAWLSNLAPFRQAIETTTNQALASINMPTRGDVSGLAERLTNIELRLDDLDAKLDEFLRAAQPRAVAKGTRSSHAGTEKE